VLVWCCGAVVIFRQHGVGREGRGKGGKGAPHTGGEWEGKTGGRGEIEGEKAEAEKGWGGAWMGKRAERTRHCRKGKSRYTSGERENQGRREPVGGVGVGAE